MIRALAVVTVLAATAHTASAGVYGSLGVGNTGVDAGSAYGVNNDSRSLTLAGGYDFTKYLGAEAGFVGYGAGLNSAQYDGREYYAAGLIHIPISDGFWGFGRLGVEHTGMTTTANGPELDGNGYLFGAGFEYRVVQSILPVPHAGIWVGYTRNNSSLVNQARPTTPTTALGASMWSIGITIGM